MSLPDVTVEIAFDSGFSTAEGDRTWTDVSAYVEGNEPIDITYGRSDELTTPDPNACTVTFDNRDGRFTPEKSSSPYYPNVKKGKPLRVTVTYNAVDYVRFTGYVDEWPVVWPDGSSSASTITVSASSRRARMGQTAPLTSAIRAAYLESEPETYWPMTQDQVNFQNRQIFRDATNRPNANNVQTQSIGSFYDSAAMKPVVHDGTDGPTDEESLVKLVRTTDAADPAWHHYVGGGAVTNINTGAPTGDFSGEVVARMNPGIPPDGENVDVVLFRMGSAGLRQEVYAFLYDSTNSGGSGQFVGLKTIIRDDSFAITDESGWFVLESNQYPIATDGEIHHFAIICSAGFSCVLYMDGVAVAYCGLDYPNPGTSVTFTERFNTFVMGNITLHGDLWVGHAATYDRSLTEAEIIEHAAAATAASETLEERVVRVAGRIGIPEAEVDVETSISPPPGPQPEAGRSGTEVIEEVATSGGGILYDTREGHLAMQARNHRYNASNTFTLSALTQEVGSDLQARADDRYLINRVQMTLLESDYPTGQYSNQDSIDDYGVYETAVSVVSESPTEAAAAASNLLYRFAQPKVRISQVSVDLLNLSDAQRAAVLNADIGTKFTVADLPSQAPATSMPLFLEGYSESISTREHTLTINTTPADLFQSVLILDDATFGDLDSVNVLAY